MKQLVMIVTIGWLSVADISCSDKSTDPGSSAKVAFSWQSSKCVGGTSAKVTGIDSLFAYSFKDSLVIDFSGVFRPGPFTAARGPAPPAPPGPGNARGFLVLPGGVWVDPHRKKVALAWGPRCSPSYFRNLPPLTFDGTIPL